jgi:hypothetical protein
MKVQLRIYISQLDPPSPDWAYFEMLKVLWSGQVAIHD